MQPDPNASGQTLLEAAAYNGRGLGAIAAAFDLEGRLGDGLNLYQYLGSNPWRRSDAMGLSWDPFSMVDDYIAESMGERLAFMEQIGAGAKMAAYVGAMIVSMLPFPVTGVAADIGASALEGQMPPELQAARKYLGYAQLGAIGAVIGKMVFTGIKTAALYVMRHGIGGTLRNMWNGAKSFASKAWNWISRKRKAAPASCALCFSAATLVWTGCGQVPIQAVQIGDLVVTQDEATGALSLDQVTAKYEISGAMLTNLRVAYPNGRVETIETTDEHPFWTSERGWSRVDTLHPGDTLHTLGGPARVEAISFTSVRKTVYNFTVGGHANYFVSDYGVWVHNCRLDVTALSDVVRAQWNNLDKLEHHYTKHAIPYNKSIEDYTSDAVEFFWRNRGRAEEAMTEIGPGLRIPGNPGGYFTHEGKIVTFWYGPD